MLKNTAIPADADVVIFCQGIKPEITVLEYGTVFGLIRNRITAIVYDKGLVKTVGGLNHKLHVMADFELACRLAERAEICVLAADPNAESAVGDVPDGMGIIVADDAEVDAAAAEDGEHLAYTCAYIIRHHLKHLTSLELMDSIFQQFCTYMQEKGVFSVFQQAMNRFLSDEAEYERIARQTAPFIVLRGDDTCGGVLQNFADDLSDALVEWGQAVIEVDDTFSEHERIQNAFVKGVVGFQAKALEIDFFKNIKGPKFQFWFDYPLHFDNILKDLAEDYYILCQDADHAELIKTYHHIPNAVQFPPGGIDGGYSTEKERPYDIVFIGSYFTEDIEDFTENEKEFYEYMLAHPQLTLEQGLTDIMAAAGKKLEEDDSGQDSFPEEMYAMKRVRRALIAHYRKRVIDTILDAGYSVHVYGESWHAYQGKSPKNLIMHPQVTVRESLAELGKAKIGLNVMSWHKSGMTERVANILLSGAVCLTEETGYIREHFADGQDLVCFSLAYLEELPEKIKALLEQPEMREDIAQKGYMKAQSEHTWYCRAGQLIAMAEEKTESSLGIFVATHVKFNPPDNPIYIPLHVGRSGKQDLGYLGDDTGENISDLNFLYGELTGLFWIWQNINNMDYVGICHYRRFFLNSQGREMQKKEYLELLEQYDAIVPNHAKCEGTYYKHFGRAHNSHDLDAVGRALKRIYPEYADAYDKAMNGNIYYGGNLIVTGLPLLKAYAEWLFTIFAEASEEIDVSEYDNYHKRVYGFLSEQMFYVFSLANNLRCCEVQVGISEEKAETKALKEQVRVLLADGRQEEAAKLFDRSMRDRPDLLLPGSDINGELNELYKQLLDK